MIRMWRWILTGVLVSLAILSPAAALVPAASSEADVSAVARQIDDTQDAGADERIAQRIREIFGELPALASVSVAVNEGVVSLSGTVSDTGDADQAENIASRISGVVTVQNRIERDISLDENLGSIGGLSDKFSGFVKMLPLIGAAIAVALLISLIGYGIAGLSAFWKRVMPNSFLADLIASAIRFVFVVGGLVIALDMIGAGALLGAVLGGAGVVGVALGFAMRDTIENYVASLMLSLRQPFRANDHVVIDTMEGRVVRLTSRATVLMTLDGNHLRIPNSTVFKAVIINYTRNPQRRFDFELGIDADDDPGAARNLGIKVLQGLDYVLDQPEPGARVEQVGDSNIVIKYLGWIDQREADWHKARSEAIAAVKNALENAGFALPEPIYRLRFDADMPLPTGQAHIERKPRPKGEQQAKTKPKVAAEACDIAPDNQVEDMVQAERSSETQDQDLLDSKRPVE